MHRRPRLAAALGLAAAGFAAGPAVAAAAADVVGAAQVAGRSETPGGAGNVMTSDPSPFNGLNVNHFLGADRFYLAGYTGTRATAALIEGGVAWAGHRDLRHVRQIAPGDHADASPNVVRRHATWVGSHIGGRGEGAYPIGSAAGNNGSERWGIAHGTTLYSGNVADGFFSNGNYDISSWEDIAAPYRRAISGGMDGAPAGGPTADVVNSSWGFTDPDGNRRDTVAVDAMIFGSGVDGPAVVSVVSATNDGPGGNTVGGFAAGYNSISVGALGGANGYDEVAGFSSRGPNDWRVATSEDIDGGAISGTVRRAAVDIAAPGQTLMAAQFDNGGDANQPDNFYTFSVQGTSFSAPLVAGGAALVVDAGRDLYSENYAVGAKPRDRRAGREGGAAELRG